MKETLKHQQAFEFYYKSGGARALLSVAQKFGVSETTTKRWSRDFNWQNRIILRDAENAKELARRTNEKVVDEKAAMLADVKSMIKVGQAGVLLAGKNLTEGELSVDNARDFLAMATGYEKLAKFQLVLMGEPAERSESDHNINLGEMSDDERTAFYTAALTIGTLADKKDTTPEPTDD